MKRIFESVRVLMMGTIVLTVVSCSDDDKGGSGNPAPEYDGTRLTAIDDWDISYDNQGRVVRIDDGYDELTIDYSNNRMSIFGESGDVKFNSQGYLSECYTSFKDEDYSGWEKDSFSYNSDGNLTKFQSTYHEQYDGEIWDETIVMTLTWKNGNVVTITTSEEYDDETWNETVNISYGNDKNTFNQFPLTLWDYSGGDSLFGIIGATGLIGKGPAMLPDNLEIEEDYYSDDLDIYFTLNNNGSIKTESTKYDTYYYYYGSVSSKAAKAKASRAKLTEKKVKRLFTPRHTRAKSVVNE